LPPALQVVAHAKEVSHPDTMAEFLMIPESDRLVRGFLRLKDGEASKKVTDLIDWLASAS
jgi:hypothetical protein